MYSSQHSCRCCPGEPSALGQTQSVTRMASLLLTQDWLLDCAVCVMSVDVQLALSSVYMHVLCLYKQR